VKKRTLLIAMGLLLIVSLIATACAQPAPAPAPVPAPAPAPAPAPLPEVHWTWGCSEATHDEWNVSICDVLTDNVRQRTDGKFDITLYVSGEVGIQREAFPKALSTRAFDMGWHSHGHITGIYPHVGIFSMPFLVGSDVIADGKKIEAAIHDITAREFGKQGISQGTFFAMTPVQLISKKTVADMSNLDGLKVRAWDDTTSNIVKSIKGEPVIMSVTETYVSMQRGVVDAVLTGVPAMLTQSLTEQAKSLYLINLAPSFVFVAYNNESFEALPKEYQDILLDELDLLDKRAVEAQPIADKGSLDKMTAAGVELISPPADQMERVRAQVKPLWEGWAAETPVQKEAYDAVMAAFGY